MIGSLGLVLVRGGSLGSDHKTLKWDLSMKLVWTLEVIGSFLDLPWISITGLGEEAGFICTGAQRLLLGCVHVFL